MQTIGLDTRCHVDCGLVHLKKGVEIYDTARVDMVANQAHQLQNSDAFQLEYRYPKKMQLDVGNEPYLSKQKYHEHLLT